MKNTVRSNLWLLIAGLVTIALGVFCLISDNLTLQKQTVLTTATVIGYEENWSADADESRYEYYIIARYQNEGEWVEGRYNQPYSSPPYAVGASVAIRYDPDKPEEFSVDGDRRGAKMAAWAIPVGCALLALALRYMIREGKKPNEKQVE